MRAEKVAEYGLMTALALALSWLEAQLPGFFAVPGMKLGLTNLVVLTALYRRGAGAAACINLVRIVLTAFPFGSMSALLYSLAGGICSYAVMIAARRSGQFSMTGVSIAGGIAHNAGQIAAACLVLESAYITAYLPPLLIAGTASGAVIGLLGAGVLRRLPHGCE